ncbi:phosphodiester glycosidase family protein [Rufibacter sp. LB8]|uniref:phosphodiester glycosidase family protein n=1 Tax=Rufibacter sp. LB8 TaxID=2777781 RepID=UPI00178C554C|nr:phosphodiester glycosidase family protein [Rufibacter sp. LB8]
MKKSVLPLKVLFLAGWLLCCTQPLFAQLNLTWTKPAELNAGLPPSVQVFYSNTPVNGAVMKTYYALIDLNDPNLEFKTGYIPGVKKTPNQWAAAETDPVYAVVNGGFFNTTTNVALGTAVQDGQVLAINAKDNRTRSVFGVLPGNIADIAWIYHVGAQNTMYQYPNPNTAINQSPSATFPAGAQLWPASTALGAGPVIVHNGQLRITKDEEAMWASGDNREPRTGIGRTADNKVILMVVEGRNPGISSGVTIPEMAQIFLGIGAHEAMNFDGGGSSALAIQGKNTILPSDAGEQRAVPTALLVKRRTHVYDTENGVVYFERGGAWTESANTGFHGPSKSRVIETGDGSKFATYKLAGINPGRYELKAWWVAANNRSTNTPYTIYRSGAASPVTVRVDQTANGSKFNVIGTYDLGPNDSIVISNDAQGQFVVADALSLIKVGESLPAISFAGNQDRGEAIENQNSTFNVTLASPNSGFTLSKLRIFKKVNGGAEAQVGDEIALNGVYTHTYPFTYNGSDPVGANVSFRFELEDSFGRTVSRTFDYTVVTLTQVVFKGGAAEGTHPQLRPLSLELSLETRQPAVNVKELKVFKSVNGGSEQQVGTTVALAAQPQQDYTFTTTLSEAVNSKVNLRFELTDANNVKASRTYQATVAPPRGDFRLAVISDLNSSFGSVTYEWQVDSIMQRIPRLWRPDMVVAGGDMIAGQSATLTATQVAAMWAGFDAKVAQPLKAANIPFAFTMGNHDAALALDRTEAEKYWKKPENMPSWHPVDMTNYPFYFSYKPTPTSDIFFVSWEASSATISASQLEWVRAQFTSPEARAAKFRFLIGHLPLYGAAAQYNIAGNVLNNATALQAMMEELDVHTYISGHHHAYYPGKHGSVEFLNAGAAGSGPRAYMGLDEVAPNSVTLMDIFVEQDTIIYTTYEIKEQIASNMKITDEKRLPEIMNGVNGYMIRRDIAVSGAGVGSLSSYNKERSRASAATGTVTTVDQGQSVQITGSFSNLQGTLLPERGAVGLYQGSYPSDGVFKMALEVTSTNGRSGTFKGTLPANQSVKELLSTGMFYVLIKTDAFPAGELRTQIYRATNQGPAVPVFATHNGTDTYPIRNIKAVFPVRWNAAKDPEANAVTYTYQLAKDEQFTQLLVEEATATALNYTAQQEKWFALLGEENTATFYHRVIASDGKNVTVGATQALKLEKNADPVTGPVNVPAPNFVYDCKTKDADGKCIAAFGEMPSTQGHGVVIDRKGRTWSAAYGLGIRIHAPNGDVVNLANAPGMVVGSNASGSHISSLTLNGATHAVSNVRGLGLAHDGNILVVVRDRVIYKLSVETGQPLASWDGTATVGTASFTNPTSTADGKVYVGSVSTNANWLLKQSTTEPTKFELLANGFTLPERAGTIRSSMISPEGNNIYVPSSSLNRLFNFHSANGLTAWNLVETINMPNPASNSVYAAGKNKVYVVANTSGNTPPTLMMRDDTDPAQKISWTLPLPEVVGNDLRGLWLSKGEDTLYTTAANGFIYRYIIPATGGTEVPRVLEDMTIGQARPVNTNGVATQAGKYVRVKGVVNATNLSRAYLDLALTSGGQGIQVYKVSRGEMTYTPTLGDSIAAIGVLRQYNGQLRLEVDSVRLIQAGKPLISPSVVTAASEELESYVVQFSNATLVNPAQWTTGQGYHGFEVQLQTEGGIVPMFIPATSDLYNLPAPNGRIHFTGVVQQFKAEAPYTSGYYVVPLGAATLTGVRTDTEAQQVAVYPVPTSGSLQVQLPESLRKGTRLQVTDLAGKTILVKETKTHDGVTLDLSNQAAGVYLVVLHTPNGKVVRRVVKQ